MLALLAVLACHIPDDPHAATTSVRDAYFQSWCRLYGRPLCVRTQPLTCSWDRTWDTQGDCVAFLAFKASDCPDLNQRFIDETETVHTCIDDLTGFGCGDDDFCTDDVPVDKLGACGQIRSFSEELCPGIYGD
jgi:hypothetical protein